MGWLTQKVLPLFKWLLTMLDAITGLLLLAMVMTPGVPGEFVYSETTGEDWREERISYVVRVLLIGMIGLAITIVIVSLLGGPEFAYADSSFPSSEVRIGSLEGWQVGGVFLIHLAISLLVGGIAGEAHRRIAESGNGTIQPYAWDDLINTHVPDHWVVIVTKEGDAYAGKVETADDYVGPSERDILLEEPARYDGDKDGYYATEYQHLFFPADLIESVAVVSNPDDERLAEVGQQVL